MVVVDTELVVTMDVVITWLLVVVDVMMLDVVVSWILVVVDDVTHEVVVGLTLVVDGSTEVVQLGQ